MPPPSSPILLTVSTCLPSGDAYAPGRSITASAVCLRSHDLTHMTHAPTHSTADTPAASVNNFRLMAPPPPRHAPPTPPAAGVNTSRLMAPPPAPPRAGGPAGGGGGGRGRRRGRGRPAPAAHGPIASGTERQGQP